MAASSSAITPNALSRSVQKRDEASDSLAEEKRKRGFAQRDDIQTFFDFHKADEAEG